MFITFEGLDFSGKTTQIKLLEEFLKKEGKKTLIIREPGGTEISEKIREILLDKKNSGMFPETELLLFYASRSQLFNEVILPKLKEGFYILSDRFFDSSIAYQGYGRGLGVDFIKQLNNFALKGYEPDLTFFIDLTIEKIEERKRQFKGSIFDRIETSGRMFYEKVREGYLQLAKDYSRFVLINGDRGINDISNEIIKIVTSHPKYGEGNEK